jgi:hypothetical protein
VTNVRAGGQIVMFGALLAALGGCAAIGFDPLKDSNNPLPFEAGTGGTGGTAGTVAGQSGGSGGSSGQISSGTGGTGGRSGQGGSAGNIMPPDDASVPLPDGGPPPVTVCTGKSDYVGCDDGRYCNVGEYCLRDECVGGDPLECFSDCKSGTCDEDQDKCLLTPLPDGTECGGSNDKRECIDGNCPTSDIECTAGECSPECINPLCIVECTEANACRTTCDNGERCIVDCTSTVTCELGCTDATCDIDCRNSGTCDVECIGEEAVCEIKCTDPSGCEGNRCLEGATCILFCDEEAEDCGFAECWSNDQRQCPDGSVRCYDECPDEQDDPDAGP